MSTIYDQFIITPRKEKKTLRVESNTKSKRNPSAALQVFDCEAF